MFVEGIRDLRHSCSLLVGEDGVILKNVAIGADAITALAHEGLGKGEDWENAFSSR